jgi:ubiquinone/menaquinone biosynthesis C-methylase UbiE
MLEGFPNKKPVENISVEEKIFKQYVNNLRLSSEDLKKAIVEVGTTDTPFVKWIREHDPNSQINSLESVEDISKPDESIDLIVSNGIFPNVYLRDYYVKEKIKNSFSEMLRVLKNGGEIRLARVLLGERYQFQMVFTDSFNESLKELQEKYDFEIEKIHTPIHDSYEQDNNGGKKLLAKSFLIILKKAMISKK